MGCDGEMRKVYVNARRPQSKRNRAEPASKNFPTLSLAIYPVGSTFSVFAKQFRSSEHSVFPCENSVATFRPRREGWSWMRRVGFSGAERLVWLLVKLAYFIVRVALGPHRQQGPA